MGSAMTVFSRPGGVPKNTTRTVLSQHRTESNNALGVLSSGYSAAGALSNDEAAALGFAGMSPVHAHITSLDLAYMADPLAGGAPRVLVDADTPREDATYKTCIPYTPTSEEAQLFKYYCPLCMLHFQHVLTTPCCKNYICLTCTKEWLKSKHIERVTLDELSQLQGLENVHCPNCNCQGFHPARVQESEAVRDYSINEPRAGSGLLMNSPLRIGESFEDMKRKMLPYRIPPSSDTVAGIAIVEEESEGQEEEQPLIAAVTMPISDALIQQLNATPLMHVSRESDPKDGAPFLVSSSKSDDHAMGTIDAEDVHRLAGEIATPINTGRRRNSHDELEPSPFPSPWPLALAEDKGGRAVNPDADLDLLNDRLSESGMDILEETAAESTSTLFLQFDRLPSPHKEHHRLAAELVGGIFHRALFPSRVPLQ